MNYHNRKVREVKAGSGATLRIRLKPFIVFEILFARQRNHFHVCRIRRYAI
jgi:hypothetical protein